MIIMINGAFGVGKTTVSNELQKEIENSMIFDPEEIGTLLGKILPVDVMALEARTGDFQDLELWKQLTVTVAEHLIAQYKVNLIVPMTIRKVEYFNYIFDGFKKIDEQTTHFCLTANQETIFDRLRERGEEEGNWCFQQTSKCLKAYKEHDYGDYINTENVPVHTIVQTIKEKLKIVEAVK